MSFSDEIHFDKRLAMSKKIKELHKDRIPVIIEKSQISKLPKLDRCKYLIPNNMEFSYIIKEVSKKFIISNNQSFFLFINNNNNFVLPAPSSSIQELYDKYKSDDGFLYIIYNEESVFG